MFQPSKVIKNLAFVFGLVVSSFSLSYAVLAWSEPAADPPGLNVSSPLTMGPKNEIKEGNLQVNALGIQGAGSVLLVPNGNVGIGTSSPTQKLNVVGVTKLEGSAIINNPAGGFGLTVEKGVAMFNDSVGIIDSGWDLDFTVQGTSKFEKGVNLATASGNVGIGTTSPSAKLEVAGQIKITGGTPGAGKVLTSDAGGLAFWTTPTGGGVGGSGTANYLSKWTGAASLGNSAISDDGNKVFIGTSSIAGKLNVFDATGNALSAGSKSGTGVFGASDSGAGVAGVSVTNNGVYGITSGNVASGVLGRSLGGSNGVAGISGWSNGVYGLSTSGYGVYGSGSTGIYGITNGVGYGVSGVASSTDGVHGESTSGSGVYGKSTSGSGVNGYSANSTGVWGVSNSGWAVYGQAIAAGGWAGYFTGGQGVYVGGNLQATGNATAAAFLYSSDKRLKKNIQVLDNSLERVLKLNGVSFNWKNSGEAGIGLIAQNVETVYPELVKTDSKTGMKSVEYGNLAAPLIEAIKEQQKMIESLQREINDLKLEIKK